MIPVAVITDIIRLAVLAVFILGMVVLLVIL